MKNIKTAIKTAEVKAAINRKTYVVTRSGGSFFVQALDAYTVRRRAAIVLANMFDTNHRELIIRPK